MWYITRDLCGELQINSAPGGGAIVCFWHELVCKEHIPEVGAVY